MVAGLALRSEVYTVLNEGLGFWHRGKPYEAHESWEQVWLKVEGAERRVTQALVQLAAASIKARENNQRGVQLLLGKARDNLQKATSLRRSALGLDLVELATAVSRLENTAEPLDIAALLPRKLSEVGFVYLHGFASSPGSAKAVRFEKVLSTEGYAVRLPDLDEDDFEGLTVTRALTRTERCLFDRTVLVGSSMGAYIATLVAHREPSRVRALVLMAPAFDIAERLAKRHPAPALARWRREGRLLVEHYRDNQMHPISWSFMEDAARHPGRPKIPEPAYVLTGLRDDVVPVDLVREVVALSGAGVELVVVDDDHGLIGSVELALGAARAFGETRLLAATG